MPDPGVAGTTGFWAAAGVVIGAILTSLTQRSLARENNARADRLAREASRFTLMVEDRRVQRDRLEEAHQLLLLAAQEFSLTNSTHLAQADTSVVDWNARSRRMAKKLHRLQMIADLYAPSMSDTVRGLAGKGETFCWRQQTLLYQLSLKNPNAYQTVGQEIAEVTSEIRTLVANAQRELVDEAERMTADSTAVVHTS